MNPVQVAMSLMEQCHGDHAVAILVADENLGEAMRLKDQEKIQYWSSVCGILIPNAEKILAGEYDA